MYIKTTKSKGHEYLYLVEEVYQQGAKKTLLLERLGRTDLIAPKTLDTIRSHSVDGRKYTVANIERNLSGILPAILGQARSELANDDEPNQERSADDDVQAEGSIPDLHYGHLIVKSVWIETLGLNRLLNSLQREKLPRLSYQLSSVGYFLCASKMMEPSSYLGLFAQNSAFLANPIATVSLDAIYRALDYLGQFKDRIMRCAYTNISQAFGLSKPSLLFFDCTNFYFEAPYTSKDEFIMDYQKECSLKMLNNGKSSEAIQEHLQSQQFIDELQAAVEQADKDGKFTRMYGPSKEGRNGQPLMGLALVIDEHGFPLDFELFPGNKSEFGYLRSAVLSIKEKYGIIDAFYVADRGLNSSQNLQFIQAHKLGFIVAQKVSQQNITQRNEMLSADGWKTIDFTKDPWTVELFEDIDGVDYRYKVCDHKKIYSEQNEDVDDKGRRKRNRKSLRKIEVNCKIIYTFSEKRRRRDLCVINAMVARAQAEIAAGKFAGSNKTGCHSFLRTRADVENSKADKEQYRYVELDQDKIAKAKEIAGYAALVYSAPDSYMTDNNSAEPLELLAQKGYKHLVSIEDCFRTAKSLLNLRPVFLKDDARTKGHCLICILSLMMLKVLQSNLLASGVKMSFSRIQQALNHAMVAVLPSAYYHGKALYLNNHKPWRDVAAARKLGNPSPSANSYAGRAVALVTRAAGLQPIKAIELDRHIRLKLKVDPRVPLLSAEQVDLLRVLANQMYS